MRERILQILQEVRHDVDFENERNVDPALFVSLYIIYIRACNSAKIPIGIIEFSRQLDTGTGG